MTQLQEVNLQDILSDVDSESIGRASALLRPRANQQQFLSRLLRDFRESAITDAETWKRDDIDNLIDVYSLLEVASICRFIPNPLPETLKEAALNHLNLPSLQRFYTSFHPQLLPQAFRRRLEGEADVFEREYDGNAADFLFFLDATRNLADDEDVDLLLTFLDGYIVNNKSWSDVRIIVESPNRFARAITSAKGNAVASAATGFWKFTEFCTSFHAFLESLDAHPIMQSAMWHYHAYWFDQLKDELSGTVESSLDRTLSLLASSSELRLRDESVDLIAERRRAFRDLFSTKYQFSLEAAMRPPISQGGHSV